MGNDGAGIVTGQVCCWGSDVADVLCHILLVLWELEGGGGPQPVCLTAALEEADFNCSLSVTVIDTQLAISTALSDHPNNADNNNRSS